MEKRKAGRGLGKGWMADGGWGKVRLEWIALQPVELSGSLLSIHIQREKSVPEMPACTEGIW